MSKESPLYLRPTAGIDVVPPGDLDPAGPALSEWFSRQLRFLQAQLEALRQENEALRQENGALRQQNSALTEKIAKLTRQDTSE